MGASSTPVGTPARSRSPFSRLRSEVVSPYQSPPPPYLSRAIVNSARFVPVASGGPLVARAGRTPAGPGSATTPSASAAANAAAAARATPGLPPPSVLRMSRSDAFAMVGHLEGNRDGPGGRPAAARTPQVYP